MYVIVLLIIHRSIRIFEYYANKFQQLYWLDTSDSHTPAPPTSTTILPAYLSRYSLLPQVSKTSSHELNINSVIADLHKEKNNSFRALPNASIFPGAPCGIGPVI